MAGERFGWSQLHIPHRRHAIGRQLRLYWRYTEPRGDILSNTRPSASGPAPCSTGNRPRLQTPNSLQRSDWLIERQRSHQQTIARNMPVPSGQERGRGC